MATNINDTLTAQLAQGENENENKFLSFCLMDEEYGVEILKVREIIGVIDITPLPQTPEYVKGVINLRGKIIPVIELRLKFGMETVAYTEETCVIVVEVCEQGNDERFQMGVIVDTVQEVLDIAKDQIEPAPNFGCSMNTEYILGMGKVKFGDTEKVVILLEIDKVVTQSDLSVISHMTGNQSTSDSQSTQTEENAAA